MVTLAPFQTCSLFFIPRDFHRHFGATNAVLFMRTEPHAHGLTCLPIVQANQKAPFRLYFFSFAQSLPIVHHSTDQTESDMGVVCGATPHTMVVQQYCCYWRDSAHYGSTAILLLLPQRRPSGVRRTLKNKHDTKTCCPCLPCDEEGGLCRTAAICPGWNSACDVGRPAGKKSRAGAGKPGAPSQADKRRKICLLYTSPSPRDGLLSRMPSSA